VAKESKIVKNYELGPLDLRRSLVNREASLCVSQSNIGKDAAGQLTTRAGREIVVSASSSDSGLVAFKDSLFALSSSLSEITPQYHSLSNLSGNSIYVRKDIVSNSWIFSIASGVSAQSVSLGTGREASPVTNAMLASWVSFHFPAVSFAPAAGMTQAPAAFIPKMPLLSLAAASHIDVPQRKQVPVRWESGLGDSIVSAFVGASSVGKKTQQLNDVLYIADRSDLFKYDGGKLQISGVEQFPDNTTGVGTSGGGNVGFGSYQYLIFFAVKDAQGNYVEGEPRISSTFSQVAGALGAITLSFGSLAQAWRPSATLAFPANWGAVVTGDQTGVTTINCDNGAGGPPCLGVGDVAYFYDGVSGTYVERTVEGVSASSISISGAAVNVYNNYPISPNIRVNIFRTKVGPSSIFYKVDEIPLDISASQSYVDTKYDDDISDNYIFALTSKLPYPQDYITITALGAYRGLLLLGRRSELCFSDIESPEYFPLENRFYVNTFDSSFLVGFAQRQDHFLAFKENSIAVISGDLSTDQYTIDIFSNQIGCCSSWTIVDANQTTYWADRNGIYRQRWEGVIEIISDGKNSSIQAFFDQKSKLSYTDWATTSGVDWDNSAAYFDPNDNLYVITFPGFEKEDSENAYEDYRTFVFNIDREEWYEWPDWCFTRGVAITHSRNIWLGAKEVNPLTSAVENVIRRKLAFNSRFDSSDDSRGISWHYRSGYETLGEPHVNKKALRATIESFGSETNEQFSVRFRMHSIRHEATTDTTKIIEPGYRDAIIKVREPKAFSHAFELSGDSVNEKPLISGVEIEFTTPFRAVIKK
jgi:hypothetical protein